MKKTNLAVIFGGASSEHEVSLRSAVSVIENIPTDKYNVIMIAITKDGKWFRYNGDLDRIRNNSYLDSEFCYPAVISPDTSHKGLIELREDGMIITPIDVIFPVLHGKNGEDGTIQGLFEIAGIPYVGCGVNASAMCMDKEITHIILESAGIKTAKWHTLKVFDMADFDEVEAMLKEKLAYPMFVKPANAGSSVGVSKARDKASLKTAVEAALLHDEKVIVEEFIDAVEVECAVIGNNETNAPVVGELELHSEFYDYEAKYLNDTTTIHIPARIPDKQAEEIRHTAVKAYKALGCSGLSRVDFFAVKNGDIILNEINTLPGFTSISMYPKMIMHSGVTYGELLDRLINLAFDK